MREIIRNPYQDTEAGRQLLEARGLTLTNSQENIDRLLVEPGYAKIDLHGEVAAEKREEEPITGLAAEEFAAEARLHPERYRFIAQHVKWLAGEFCPERPTIMDFGSGPGILTSMIAQEIPNANVMGIDLSQDMLDLASDTVKDFGVEDRIRLYQYDVKGVYKGSPEQADIVVSRNMLHRLDSLEEGLMRMVRATKESGGIVYNTSFRNMHDLDKAGMEKFIRSVLDRNEYPNLQEAYALAYLHAPTLAQYQEAALKVAKAIDAQDMEVRAGQNNEVDVYIRRRK